jgi:hypothetical protein
MSGNRDGQSSFRCRRDRDDEPKDEPNDQGRVNLPGLLILYKTNRASIASPCWALGGATVKLRPLVSGPKFAAPNSCTRSVAHQAAKSLC